MQNASQVPVRSWGRIGAPLHDAVTPTTIEAARQALGEGKAWLPHGLGRSYGDVALNAGERLIVTTSLDRFIRFDAQAGLIEAEAGVTLEDIIRVALPRGWFLPTTPGTRYVTLGGAIANDVHGKNHHRAGTFGCWVRELELARSDGSVTRCSPEESPELFAATIGGMGLTGLITRATLQLVKVSSAYLDSEDIVFRNLDEFFSVAEESDASGWEHTVGWMDCVGPSAGRGIFSRANWRNDGDLSPRLDGPKPLMPMDAPGFLLNRFSIQAFNALFFRLKAARAGRPRVHFNSCFYPLDAIRDWNRFYGRRGFYQYQCVVPRAAARDAIGELLDEIARSGQASFLVVIKTFGDRKSPGAVSFPMPGTNLALDFPNRGKRTFRLFERLDRIVAGAKGRIYPAKDARMPGALLRAGYPQWQKLAELKDPGIHSDFWNRMIA